MDLTLRCRDLNAHYTYSGLIGESELSNLYSNWLERISLFDLSKGNYWAVAIFVGGFFSAIALLVGWNVRFSAFLCWLFLYSIQRRNPVIFNGGDVLLRLFLMWLIILPAQQTASDRKFVTGGAVCGITLQLCMVYLISAFAKGHPMWRVHSNAVEHALRLESFHTPLATWLTPFLLQHPQALSLVTNVTLLLEEIGPLILLFSWHWPLVRISVVTVFVFFHVFGIAAFLNIGVFPFVCAAGWLLFLPRRFFDAIQSIPYVGHLFACTWQPLFTEKRQDPVLAGTSRLQMLSWSITVYVMAYNVFTFNMSSQDTKRDHWLWAFGRTTGLAQNWQLFAPYVNTRDGWYVGEATLSDGSKVDPIRQVSPVVWDKPPRLASEYRTKRWRRYLHNLYHNRNPVLINSYARFVSQSWLLKYPQTKIKSLKIYFMMQDSLFPNDGITKIQVYPIEHLDEHGHALFPGDARRNLEMNHVQTDLKR